MKNKATFCMVFALFSVIPLFGQRGTGQVPGRVQGRPGMSEENVKTRVDRLAENLEMNEEQHKEILDYELEQFKQNQVERQRLMGDREAMRDYMMKQREERDEKYKEVLTDEQWNKYQDVREQRRRDNQNRQRPGNDARNRQPRGRGQRIYP